jgi:hypothetical protein
MTQGVTQGVTQGITLDSRDAEIKQHCSPSCTVPPLQTFGEAPSSPWGPHPNTAPSNNESLQ